MDLLEPHNFFDMAGLIAGLITGLIAIAGLNIATATYFTAKEALKGWEKERRFDIDIEGMAKSLDAIRVLEDLKIEQYDPEFVRETWDDVLSDIVSYGENNVYRSFVNLFSYSRYYQNLKDRMFDMRKQSIKVLNISNNSDLIDFYDKYITVEANIFAIHHNYHVSVINSFIDRFDYKSFSKEGYAQCLYFNALKAKEPNSSDEILYKDLYFHFFQNVGGDPIDALRQQHITFYYQKLKNK